MTTLKESTRTKLHVVVNPGTSFLSDPDLEHHFRTLAGNEERIAQQAKAAYAKFRSPGSRGAADFHADKAVTLHQLANEQRELHRPTPPMPKQIPDTRISRGLEQVTIALACIVAALGLLGWLLVRAGML